MSLKAIIISRPPPTLTRPVNPIPTGLRIRTRIRIGISFISSFQNPNSNPNPNRNLLHRQSSQGHSATTRASLLFTAAMSDEASQSSPAAAETVRVLVKGRVQGVFYRNWTIENARVLGLRGWVRNRRDGSVEALFSGNTDSVAEMQRRCRRGPPAAVVTGFEVFPSSDDPGNGFDRKPTV